MIWRAGPTIEDGKPINLKGSGNKTRIIVAKTVPFNDANPPTITIAKTGIN